MRIGLGQISTTVGDMAANSERIAAVAHQAAQRGAQAVVFPELAIPGNPPLDLLARPGFIDEAERQLARLAELTALIPVSIVVGSAAPGPAGRRALSIAAVLRGGREIGRRAKAPLVSAAVSDDERHFLPGAARGPIELDGESFGVIAGGVSLPDHGSALAESDFERGQPLISIDASPYQLGIRAHRHQLFARVARRLGTPAICVNQVGGNGPLVFDGSSFALDAQGNLIASAASFAEDLVLVDLAAGAGDQHANLPDEHEAAYEALVLGTRDYLAQSGFTRVLVGLSGGIDSSLVAAIAVDAVGRQNVTGVAMPGPFSTAHALADAQTMAGRLGIRFEIIPVTGLYDAANGLLAPVFGGAPRDVTEENLQSRLRGIVLMALANKWRAMVLSTGNKSEAAVGYATLYGDMCGGLAVIGDVPKTLVYPLSRVANRRHGDAIPENVFLKPPSAELAPDQKDTDSLPPYDVLDPILSAYIEGREAPQAIAARLGHDVEFVRAIVRQVDRNEYKRQQAAPALGITSRAFGADRRLPIVHRFSE